MSANIRRAEVEDLPAVYRLGLRCYNVLDKPYNYWSIREVADHIEGHPDLCFAAEIDGEVVGFLLGADSYEILQDTGHLEWIAVAPEHRLGGLATRLIETFLEALWATGRKEVVADVSSGNEASRALFARTGWSEGISVTFFTKRI